MTSSVAKTCFDAIRAKQSALAAGYDPMVVEHQSVYQQLLRRAVDSSSAMDEEVESKQKWKPRARKQTPLVNAGYASRVLAISKTIRSFVSYHKLVSKTESTSTDTKQRIRIVFLGCGVDVIGLWARSLLSKDDDETLGITIIEVDKPEVCSIKRKMIVHQNMVHNLVEYSVHANATTSNTSSNYYTGNIVPTHEGSRNSSADGGHANGYDYVLIPADLKDTSSLETIIHLDNNDKESQIPTLVVSELVLSYLPPLSTDGLFQWCADRLCRTSDSAFVALEPLGSVPMCTTKQQTFGGVRSVEEGYRQDYCQKFRDKMERGRSTTGTEPADGFFHPIGVSTIEISSRLTKHGFAFATATNLGIVSSIATSMSKSNSMVCPDVFDEHAALILHLQSYILACGFTRSDRDVPDLLFRRFMCPWEGRPDFALMRSGVPRIDFKREIVYHEIEVCDEAEARSLFQNTYNKHYTEQYPAIRKLVKAVLNNDMRETSPSESVENSSAIGTFYRSSGGIFLVASKYILDASTEDGSVCQQSSVQTMRPPIRRQVVGCIGIRSYKGKEVDPISTFEVFRLAVAADHRGRGIGTKLLGLLESYVRERLSKRRGSSLKIVANTLTILEDATKLYEKCGYLTEAETPLGEKLVLRTYTKLVGNQ